MSEVADRSDPAMNARSSMPAALRAAIWQAHSRRCAYTGDLLKFSDVQVDHIIPVNIDEASLSALVVRKIVPKDFDLNGLGNLLPTSAFQNARKGADLKGDNALIHFLGMAAEYAPKISKIMEAEYFADKTLRGYLLLKAQAERNELDVDQIIDIKRQEVDGVTRASYSPEIEGGFGVTLVDATLASELMGKSLSIGGGGIHEVHLQTDDGAKITCTTCEEFLAAKDAGAWALTQFDINCYSMADRTCEMLRALARAKYAPASLIRFPHVSLKNLDRWSSQWVTGDWFEGRGRDEAQTAPYPTLSSLIEADLCEIRQLSALECDLGSKRGFPVRIAELFRADVDGDGEEEIVVFLGAYADGGTFRAGRVKLAKPSKADGLIYPVEWTP